MAEPLNVDTARLLDAAESLRALTFPAPPARISTTGGDPVSAAINETMSIVESPVLDDLPVAKATLAKTASAIAAAASMYADTDQALGSGLAQQEFSGAGPTPAGAADSTTNQATATGAAADTEEPGVAPPADGIASVPLRDYLTAVGSAMGSVNEVMQPVNQIANSTSTFTQSIVQSAQSAANSQPAGEEHRDEAADAQADGPDEENVDGAASGEHAESVPLETVSDTTGTPRRL